MIIQWKWRQWLKSGTCCGTLSCHSKTWFYIRSVFWVLIISVSVYGFCYHYHLWDQAQKDYNDHDNKKLPNRFYIVSDISRSIGSYSESITREIYYTIDSIIGAFVTLYVGAIGFFMKDACEKM